MIGNSLKAGIVGGAAMALLFFVMSGDSFGVEPELGVKPGLMHPDFVLPSVDGKWTRLSDFRGRKVVLLHFASW